MLTPMSDESGTIHSCEAAASSAFPERVNLPPKATFANISMTLIAVAVSLVVLEGLVRWVALAPPRLAGAEHGVKPLVTFDQTLETRYIPNVSTRVKSPWNEYDVTYRTNRLGLRGADFPEKQPGQLRILAVGNSFVEGWGVEENETFTSVAENLLSSSGEKNDHPRSVRIVNGGISGYGAAQAYLNSRRLWSAVAPDIVLMVYVGTMVSADYKYLKIAAKDRNGIAQGLSADAVLQGGTGQAGDAGAPTTIPWVETASRWSALVRLVNSRFANQTEINSIKPGDPYSDLLAVYREESDAQQMLQPTLQHVSALADWTRQNGAKFIFLYLPMPFQLSEKAWNQGRKAYRMSGVGNDREKDTVRQFCIARELDCLFSDDVLSKATSKDARSVFYAYDFHLTAEGNRIVGSWLGTQIRQVLQTGSP
jgi:hypothetical protein